MKLDLEKDQLIDLIIGGIIPPFGGDLYSDCKGGDWNEPRTYAWNRSKLSRLSEEELFEFYNQRRSIGKTLLQKI